MKSVTMTGQPEVSFDDDIPTSFVLDKAMREALREPFPPNQIGQVNKGFGKVDFIGHAAITDRLNKAAPGWTYRVEPVVVTGKDGLPHVMAVFGTMTVGGVTRQEAGDVEHMTRYGDELKKAISDFLCRGAMRFGVGLDLWSKEQLESLSRETPTGPDVATASKAPVGDKSPTTSAGVAVGDGGDGVDSDPPSPPNSSAALGRESSRTRPVTASLGAKAGGSGAADSVPGGEPAQARAEKAGHGAEPPGQTSGRGKARSMGKAPGTLPETSAGAGDRSPIGPPSARPSAPVTCKHLNGVDVDDRCVDCGAKMKVSA